MVYTRENSGKVVRFSSNFQERFNSRKARKNKNETTAFCLPFIVFFHIEFKISDLKGKYILLILLILLVLLNTNLLIQFVASYRQCTLDSSNQLGFQSFMTPLILITNFRKQESKIGYPYVSNWEPSDSENEPTYSHNTTTTLLCTSLTVWWMGSLKLLYTHASSKSRNNPGHLWLPLNCASALRIHTQHTE